MNTLTLNKDKKKSICESNSNVKQQTQNAQNALNTQNALNAKKAQNAQKALNTQKAQKAQNTQKTQNALNKKTKINFKSLPTMICKDFIYTKTEEEEKKKERNKIGCRLESETNPKIDFQFIFIEHKKYYILQVEYRIEEILKIYLNVYLGKNVTKSKDIIFLSTLKNYLKIKNDKKDQPVNVNGRLKERKEIREYLIMFIFFIFSLWSKKSIINKEIRQCLKNKMNKDNEHLYHLFFNEPYIHKKTRNFLFNDLKNQDRSNAFGRINLYMILNQILDDMKVK